MVEKKADIKGCKSAKSARTMLVRLHVRKMNRFEETVYAEDVRMRKLLWSEPSGAPNVDHRRMTS